MGRKLTDGSEVWSTRLDPAGLPSAFNGRLFTVATTGLMAMQGTSGSVVWSVPAEPGQGYSYNVSPTFGNATGQLVATRCLGTEAPSLCMYSAFAPPEGAGSRAAGLGWAPWAVAAAGVAAQLLLAPR